MLSALLTILGVVVILAYFVIGAILLAIKELLLAIVWKIHDSSAFKKFVKEMTSKD